MTADLTIRPADDSDLASIVDIYNHYVVHSPITFDTRTFAVDDKRTWYESFDNDGTHRLLVAELGGRVSGYASSCGLKSRPAYDRSVETTIYLDPGAVGKGIGGALYSELIAQLASIPSLHRAYGAIALPNDASVALHAKLGFTYVGTFAEVGYKFDRYWDVAWYEKDLSGE